ncbi:MAG: helix-turn-helix domain-containing protein [Candidatus Eisenbacteria bacterium]|nr:helix-turn-helix domain-containing protein [Candidatus Eisenbacteria bacterium]
MPFSRLRLKGPRPAALPRGYPREVRTLGDHLRRRRLDLGLTQRILADRWGVRSEAIAAWELGRTKPGIRLVAKIVALLEGDPVDHPATLAGRLVAIRRRLGLTQAELAARLVQDEKQICRWERGKRTPHPAIACRIDLALRELEGRPAGGEAGRLRYFDLTLRRRRPVGVVAQPKTLGDWLRARRLELGLSAAFVARQAGMSRRTLYRIERGRQTASRNVERRLQRLLNVRNE